MSNKKIDLIKMAADRKYVSFEETAINMLRDRLHNTDAYKKFQDKLEVIKESGEKDGDEYKKFFQKKLDTYGVKSPDELDDKEKEKFYEEIDAEWKADHE